MKDWFIQIPKTKSSGGAATAFRFVKDMSDSEILYWCHTSVAVYEEFKFSYSGIGFKKMIMENRHYAEFRRRYGILL